MWLGLDLPVLEDERHVVLARLSARGRFERDQRHDHEHRAGTEEPQQWRVVEQRAGDLRAGRLGSGVLNSIQAAIKSGR